MSVHNNFSDLAGTWAIQNINVPQPTAAVHSNTARGVGTSITSTDQPLWCILTPLTPRSCLVFIIIRLPHPHTPECQCRSGNLCYIHTCCICQSAMVTIVSKVM